jgi:hypothetical protein
VVDVVSARERRLAARRGAGGEEWSAYGK